MEQVPATDLLQVYSGLESDEVSNGIIVDTSHHVVEEPSIMVGGVDLAGNEQSRDDQTNDELTDFLQMNTFSSL